jgi:hypothetical protein
MCGEKPKTVLIFVGSSKEYKIRDHTYLYKVIVVSFVLKPKKKRNPGKTSAALDTLSSPTGWKNLLNVK